MSNVSKSPVSVQDDERAEYGAFTAPAGSGVVGAGGSLFPGGAERSAKPFGVGKEGVVKSAGTAKARVVGRGPVVADPRKFRYDRVQGGLMPALVFGASKVDRMDAVEAGEKLDHLHEIVGIDKAEENVLVAFDDALFFEHTLNGASLLQPGRGRLIVGDAEFELQLIKENLGPDQRRFFRAFADEITVTNLKVLKADDAYDHVAHERASQLRQVAFERGLVKFPHLAHDSSDACLRLSVEERVAIRNSKRLVLATTKNSVDELPMQASS